MSSVPYIEFYPSDWRGGVAILSDFEEQVYFKICAWIWDCGRPIHEQRIENLFRSAPSSSIADAVKVLISERKIIRDANGFLHNPRAMKSHKRAVERVNKATAAARTRWKHKKKLTPATAYAQSMPTHAPSICHPNPDPDPDPEPLDEMDNHHPSLNSENINPNPLKSDFSKQGKGMNGTSPSKGPILKTVTYERAREIAPGHDIYFLEARWREWTADEPPKHPDKAFLGFVRAHALKNPV